jgi:5'-3' exonuclease
VKKVKKDNITPENIGEIILCQIPGISSVTAIAIMKQFGTFPKLIDELKNNPQCLDGIAGESSNGKLRKINKSSIENIRKFLLLSS